MYGNETQTITLIGLPTSSTPQLLKFMTALLNIKNCRSMIKFTEVYKYYPYKSDEEKEKATKDAEYVFSMDLEAWVRYPDNPDQFFNERGELSATILLDRYQIVCYKQAEYSAFVPVTLGDLMLSKAAPAGRIDLNHYLIVNKLQKYEKPKSDPRGAIFPPYYDEPYYDGEASEEGITKVLATGG